MNDKQAVTTFHYLLHPYNTSLVTCCDTEGKSNIITIAWLIPVSVSPPLVGMSIGPSRFSYGLIRETGEFVINVAPYDIARQVLFCGRRSGREMDKFAETGLTPMEAQHVRPPVIEECVAHLECRVVQDIEAGDHQIVVGEVLAAYANHGILEENGLYRLDQVQTLFHLGRNWFTSTGAECEKISL
ncbi:MAG: flavin reductase family protein [Anaerolineaceae bacterium]|nr:MAG: flavin reductase family protein [Anaerolineaceae bacterium]